MKSKEERQRVAEVFKLAKPLLCDGNESGNHNRAKCICLAIESIRSNALISHTDKERAIEIIEDRIYPHVTIYCWLVSNLSYEQRLLLSRLTVQEYRHLWLDALNKEFSK